MTDSETSAKVAELRNLSLGYRTRQGLVPALHDVSLTVGRGEIVALVGESGSGKSTVAHALLGLLPRTAEISSGQIFLNEEDVTGLDDQHWRRLRGRAAALIPQDPTIALNPLHRIGRQTVEPLSIHRILRDRTELRQRAVTLLGNVGIGQPEVRASQYPRSLSGGMRQRVLIASSLSAGPTILLADEPTTALDVTVQKRILDDLSALVAAEGLSVLLVTHDLALAADRASRIVVLKNGRVVEGGPVADVLGNPRTAYTRILLDSAAHDEAPLRPSQPGGDTAAEVLRVDAAVKEYRQSGSRELFRAVDGVSLSVRLGETVAVVGESGSGKTTMARIALGLIKPTRGSASFRGKDIANLSPVQMREFRQRVQIIYQNPFSSLNPRLTVAQIVREPLDGFAIGEPAKRQNEVTTLLDAVGLGADHLERRPHQLSGGQRQRVAIARALASRPELIVCDEPLSALDVTIQAQIIELLASLQNSNGLGYLFVSHDLAVVRRIADRVLVMRGGELVEEGPTGTIFENPRHEYTRELLAAIPGAALRRHRHVLGVREGQAHTVSEAAE